MWVSLLSVWPVVSLDWQRFQFRRNKKTVRSVRLNHEGKRLSPTGQAIVDISQLNVGLNVFRQTAK
jgi:hypothetical protein